MNKEIEDIKREFEIFKAEINLNYGGYNIDMAEFILYDLLKNKLEKTTDKIDEATKKINPKTVHFENKWTAFWYSFGRVGVAVTSLIFFCIGVFIYCNISTIRIASQLEIFEETKDYYFVKFKNSNNYEVGKARTKQNANGKYETVILFKNEIKIL